MPLHISIPRDRLAAFCTRWRITEVALFGSVLRDDFDPESDIDVLVSFDAGARHTLWDLAEMERELSSTLGRKADLVARDAVERSPNYIRRAAILSSAQTIYAA
ncbi:MAG: nucleotidyltransferase domain-containing protein [Gammaproteobacteria bacterium]|nr:nucleotidyltransferase domain-containing protein [Gammaproteobacteria bacterium]MDE0443352.1 nucleotidyltransferase domain-containing protein [Gammaproteobacteria bacterium]